MTTRKWKTELLVNTTTAGNQDQPVVTALADGGFVIAWRDAGPVDSLIRWQRYDALGNKMGAENIHDFVNNDSRPDLVQLSNGNLWLASENLFSAPTDTDISGIEYLLTGGSVGGRNGGVSSPNAENTPAMASLGSNGSIIVWRDAASTGGDILMRRYDGSGQSFVPVVVNTTTAGDQQTPDVAANAAGDRFVVIWNEAQFGPPKARVFDNLGNSVTAEFQVAGGSSPQQPKITWLDNARFVATWTVFGAATDGDNSGTGIRYRIFNADGTALGAERQANSTVAASQDNPAVTRLNDGGFALAWIDFSRLGGDASGTSIKLQVFDAVGDKNGSEILVNTTALGDQGDVDLATLADGRITATWTDRLTGEIRAQIIDPRDGSIDGTSGVDTLYGHDSVGDVITSFEGADTIYGLAGADTIFGGNGNDTLHGGRGDDTLFGGADQDSMLGGLGADELDGGDGVDTANYALAAFAVTASLDGTLLGTNEALDDIYISIENLTGTNIAAQGDTLRGNAAANSIAGLAGADFLNGVSGHDRLTGGTGVDTMTGGVGNDSFIYNTLTEGGDIITDFSSFAANNNDVFRFKGSVFGGLAAGAITAAQFQSSTADVAANTNIRFFYETDTRILRFDADGADPGAAITIATLQAGATMTFNDILIF